MTQSLNNSCQNCPNAGCFIKVCSPEWIQLINEKKIETQYAKKQHVFMIGHPVFGLYFIKNGRVKITTNGWQEKEQIVRLAADGHILGHRGFGNETYPISAVALDNSVICFVDNNTLYKAFMQNPKMTYDLMMFYSKELRGVEARMKGMAQMTVREKVVFALLYLKEVFGYDKKENVLNIYITRADIAALAGISKEQVVRNLTDLEKEKMIAKVSKKIRILNEDKLEKIVGMYS